MVFFFTTKSTKRPEKISWDEQRILAVKAASHEIFPGRFVLFVVQKEFLCYPVSLSHYLSLDSIFMLNNET